MVMTHSDNKGLVLPPRVAEHKAVIVPILIGGSEKKVMDEAKKLALMLTAFNPILDDRTEYAPGWKYTEWELKGIPLRIEIGPKDIANNQAVLVRRDNGKKEFVKINELDKKVKTVLEEMHSDLFKKASENLKNSIVEAKDWKDFEKQIKNKKLVKAPFCGTTECEEELKSKTEGVTARLIPFDEKVKKGSKCIYCGKEAKEIVYFSRAY